MPGLFDMLMAVTGRPTDAQLMASLGQAPGMPGSNAPGPVPGAAPADQGAVGRAPNAQQGAPPAAQGGQGGGTPAATMPNGQPAPNAFQSPSDLAQAYLQLAGRAQAERTFNNGLAGMAAAIYPGRTTPAMMSAMRGDVQDPGALFGNLIRLQQFGQEQQNRQAYIQGLDGMIAKYNLDPSLKPLLIANPDILSKIVEQRSGVGGDAITQELNSARADWRNQHPGKSDADMIADRPDLAGVLEFTGAKTEQGKTLATAAVDKVNATSSFSKIDPALAQQEQNLEWLNDPKHRQAVITAIHNPNLSSGVMGSAAGAAPGLTGIDQDVLTARVKIDQLKKELYADRFAGTKNVRSNTEANNLGAAATLLDQRNNDPETIGTELQRLVNDIGAARGNLAAAAGRQVPAKYANLVDKSAFLDKNSPLYNGATIEQSDVAAPNAQPVASPAAPPAAPAAASVPPEAAAYLKAHPELAAQFDAKYGAGASKKILGR